MSLDSLMDTLTNVVGILVIVLIFAVLGGVDSVKKIKGFVEEITPERLATTAAEAEELRRLVEQLRAEQAQAEDLAKQDIKSLEDQKKLAAQLQADLEKMKTLKIDPAKLDADLEASRKAAKSLETRVSMQQSEIASLKARLAEKIAMGGGAETKVVNLPDPREAPAGAKGVVFICKNGRVIPVDTPVLQQKAQQILATSARTLFKQDRLDCEKLKEFFDKRFVGDNFCQVKPRIGGDAKPYLAVIPRENAGDPTADISRPGSRFNGWIRVLDPGKNYVEFRVYPDSFDTYLAARNECAKKGILAGWTPYDPAAEYWIGFGAEVKTLCLGKEPPPPGKPGDPNAPKPPSDVVD